jgi:hypothetical protein
LDLGDGRRAFIAGVRPVVDTSAVVAAVGFRDDQAAMPTFTAATSPAPDGFCPQRVASRFSRARISIPAGASWSHLSAYEARIQPEGLR